MEDELMALLKNSDAGALDKLNDKAKGVAQQLGNVGVEPDYTADVSEMQKQGFHWDGYRWTK